MSIIGSSEFIKEMVTKDVQKEIREKYETKILNYLISEGYTKEETQKILNYIFSEDASET